MKVLFNKKLVSTQSVTLIEGRYVGTVVQIAALGNQPSFTSGEAPASSVGVVIQLASTQIAKKIRVSDNSLSTLFKYLDATLPDPDTYDGDDPLPLTLGCPVAVEVSVSRDGKYTKIDSFHRPEDFELKSAPFVAVVDQVMIEDLEAFLGGTEKTSFLKLHRDIRSWISSRVRT